MQHSTQELMVPTHAPDNIGFIHTSPEQFTHFSGGGAGARTTFGLSCDDLLKLFNQAYQDFMSRHGKNSQNDEMIARLLHQLLQLKNKLETIVRDFKANRLYADNGSMATALVSSGHIPIMLSGALPAVQYERAARTISAGDLQEYFSAVPFAASQCREYLVKQDMMKTIAQLRQDITQQRYKLTQKGGMPFYFCNILLQMLDSKIIDPNQKSMPRECAQFDLYETFRSTVHRHMCTMQDVLANQDFFRKIQGLFDIPRGNSFEAQRDASQRMYEFVIEYLRVNVGIAPATTEMSLSAQQDNRLDDILPLLAYLNSEKNPFARDGVFGKEISTDFYKEALDMYRRHESQTHGAAARLHQFSYQARPKDSVRFDDEQVEKLLFGAPQNQKQTGMFASMGSTLRGFLTNDTTAQSNQRSQTQERREMLALPMPREYLLLEGPKPVTPTSSAAAAAASSATVSSTTVVTPSPTPTSISSLSPMK